MEIAFDDNELLLGLFLQGYSVKEIYSLGEFILRENGDYKNLESFQNSTESNKKGIILQKLRKGDLYLSLRESVGILWLRVSSLHGYFSIMHVSICTTR